MRKTSTVIALALALAILISPETSASVKAGAACKKAGLTSITSGFKYTCVKKSGKLVWVKGVAVKASSKPKPSPTAKPSAKPTASFASPIATASPSVKPSLSATPSVTPSVTPGSYPMGQVSANKTAARCWSVINDNVYDLTPWINAHPGGTDAILSLCGTDGTQEFLAMHRGQSKPESRLSAFLLGPLAK